MISITNDKTNQLIDELSANPSHGYLISGSPASNLSYIAENLAKNWINPTNHGEFSENTIVVEPDKDNKISKEDIDKLLQRLTYKQGKKRRVVILRNAEILSIVSFNAMLKALEEPGAMTTLVITTNMPQLLPDTVKSRLQHVYAPDISVDEITNHFASSEFSQQEMSHLVHVTGGSLDLIENAVNNQDYKNELLENIKLAKVVLSSEIYNRMITVKDLSKDRKKVDMFIKVMINLCASALRKTANDRKKALQWASRIESLLEANRQIKVNLQPRLVIQQLMVQL